MVACSGNSSIKGHRQFLLTCTTILCMGLSACSILSKQNTEPVSSTGNWQGRLSLTVDSAPPERMAAGFTLEGSVQTGSFRLFSPLGSTLGEARWDSAGATLTQGASVQQFDSLDALLTHFAQAAIPVRALFDWLQGRATEVPGWQVNLSQQAQGRIFATRQYPQPTADLRLILD